MVGTAMARARKKRGLPQAEAARRLGVSQPLLSQMEHGTRTLTEDVARRASELFCDPTLLPLATDRHQNDSDLADELGAMEYPGFAYVKKVPTRNPAEVLLDALDRPDLNTRVSEGLPWLPLRYPHMDWDWLTREVKLRNRQNRLGFVVGLARQVAERLPEHRESARNLEPVLEGLEEAKLVKPGTYCHDSWSDRYRHEMATRRSPLAQNWNLFTGVRVEDLEHYTA
jgi:transcriptional regulator with XRE-family HTH domain